MKETLAHGVIPRCHFEDVTRADIYGFCVPLARELMKLSEESGIDVKIRLCDTMGYGVNFPGAALPRSVDKLVRAFIDDAGVPGRLLEWHGHNDFHKGLSTQPPHGFTAVTVSTAPYSVLVNERAIPPLRPWCSNICN